MTLRYVVSLSLIICFQTGVHGQSRKIDSLKQVVAKVTHEAKYEALKSLTLEFVDEDNKTALRHGRELQALSIELADTPRIVTSTRILGQIQRRLDEFDSAIQTLSDALVLSTKIAYDEETLRIMNALAVTYTFRANYDRALEYYLESLMILENQMMNRKLTNKRLLATSLFNIGFIYYKMQLPEIALTYYKRCLSVKKEMADSSEMDQLLINIGLCYCDLKQLNNAEESVKKGLSTCSMNCSKSVVIDAEWAFGDIAYNQGNFLKSIEHFQKSLALSVETNNTRHQMDNLLSMAKSYKRLGDLKAAVASFSKFDTIRKRSEFAGVILNSYLEKASLFEKIGVSRKVNESRANYYRLLDSVFTRDVTKNIIRIQTKLVERENQAKLLLHEEAARLQNEIIDWQRWVIATVAAGLFLTVVVLIMLTRLSKQRKSNNVQLEQRVKERTQELENNTMELLHAQNEQEVILRRVLKELSEADATMKGLVILASKELPQDQHTYFIHAQLTINRIATAVGRYSDIAASRQKRVCKINCVSNCN